MKELKDKLNTSIIFITHDLGVVADICSRINVMYGGLIMEEGTAEEVFYTPKHPYTMGLLKSIPRLDLAEKQRLVPIPGTPPDLLKPPVGCPFASRCPYAMNICLRKDARIQISENHATACWLHHPDAPKEVETPIRRME